MAIVRYSAFMELHAWNSKFWWRHVRTPWLRRGWGGGARTLQAFAFYQKQIPILADPKQISVVLKSEKQKQKTKNKTEQNKKLAHPGGQNEEENEKSLGKSKKIWKKFEEKMRLVELLPTKDCEASYGPVNVNASKI